MRSCVSKKHTRGKGVEDAVDTVDAEDAEDVVEEEDERDEQLPNTYVE